MSVIQSLLYIQALKMDEPTLRKVLTETADRVRAMAILYEKLYQSESYNFLSLKAFLPSLIEEIKRIFQDYISVDIDIDIEEFIVSVKSLSSIGIIINELITNSIKYAFNKKKGMISISVHKEDNKGVLIYKDNGIGMPLQNNIDNSSGFGMQLVDILVKQIKGTLVIETTNGTQFTITFPLKR